MEKKKSIRYKILIPTAVVVIMVSLVMGSTSYLNIHEGMVSMGTEEAMMAARYANEVVDGDVISEFKPGCEDTEAYQTLLRDMRKVQKDFGIAFLYTLYTDGKQVYYGVDTDETGNQCKVGEEFEQTYEELKDVFAGREYTESSIDRTEDGDLITVYLPIRNSKGTVVGVLGCDYNAVNVIKKLRRSVLHMVLIAVVCMIAALISVGLIVNKIMINLNIVDRKIHDLVSSDGDLTKQIDVHTGDELETIANNVNSMVGRIREQADIAMEVADGNLKVEVIPLSDQDLLGTALKHMVERNAHTLRGIHNTAQQAKMGASQMAGASEALAQGSEQQASAIAQITSSIGSVAEKTKQNSEDASIAAGLMAEAIERVNEENAQMQDLMTAMQDISQSAEDISKINKMIDDIASQTNILALNASVEAQRAGEAGKGFSVVAQEIRRLAGDCADAASQVSALIEDSLHKTQKGSDLVKDTAEALNEITEAVGKGSRMIDMISEASNKQTTAILQIDQAVGQVSKVVQTNSSASEECATSSAELSNQMALVDKMLSEYKL